MASLIENTQRVVNALNDIKAKIIGKGITPSGKCETFASAIDELSNVSDTTTTAADVKSGTYFYTNDGVRTEGNLTDLSNRYINIAAGGGRSESYIYFKKKSDEPDGIINNSSTFSFLASDFGNAPDSNVLEGNTFTSSSGIKRNGAMSRIARATITINPGEEYTIPKGYHEGFGKVVANQGSTEKVKTGTFTSTTSGYTVNCGFAPKMVFVTNNYNATTYNELGAWINGTFSGARGAGANSGGNITTSTITVSGNTFTHKAYTANFANKPAYYIAIG